jgi:hypothetical protein
MKHLRLTLADIWPFALGFAAGALFVMVTR